MSSNVQGRNSLDPDALGLDEDTRRRRRALAELQKRSIDELSRSRCAGIYTQDGQLTPPYRDAGEPSGCRPTD